jgi:hypothetical protein
MTDQTIETASQFRQKLEQRKGSRAQVELDLKRTEKELEELRLQSIYCEEAQITIQNVAQLTQKELEYHLSELGTLALASVFDDPFKLDFDFVLRRGRTEADISFSKGKYKIPPLSLGCGGEVDLTAFALRPSMWSLAPRRTSSVLFLDEPLKWLKGGNLPVLGAKVIKEVSESDLHLQIIMVSHITEQIEYADRRINFYMRDGISQIRIN